MSCQSIVFPLEKCGTKWKTTSFPSLSLSCKLIITLFTLTLPRSRAGIWGRPRERVENPEGSIFSSFSYADRANKQSPFTLNLLRSLRNAVSYTWGSWPGVWNTFELGISFSGGVYRDSVNCQFVFRCKSAGEFDFNDPSNFLQVFFAQS
jgi:hypothetical protein